MELKKLESIDSGSNYPFQQGPDTAMVPRSLDDLSHGVVTTMNNAGPIYPISLFATLPNDDHDITARCLLRCMPQVVPLYSRQRQYLYGIYSRGSDLWKNYQVYVTKGRNGTTSKTKPVFTDDNLIPDTETPSLSIQPGSLGQMLGLPLGMTRAQLIGAGVNILPFMMYLRFWRDYIINANFRSNDSLLFPDDDGDFRLNDDGQVISFDLNSKSVLFDPFTTDKGIRYDANGNLIVGIAFHEYPSDRFTSALSSPTRGPEQSLDYLVSSSLDFSDVFKKDYDSTKLISGVNMLRNQNSDDPIITPQTNSSTDLSTSDFKSWIDAWNKAKIKNLSLLITLNDLRKLSINQTMLEKLAKTDGSYSQFALSMYGINPRNANVYNPTYIGGTYKDITFTEVLQTSPTYETVGETTKKTPVGTYAGHGISGINDDYLGHVFCDEEGYIMILSCIMPDIYYSQGLDKHWTSISQEDIFLPEKCKLGMVPILNQELYYAGNNGTSQGDDKYLWAYGNIYDEYRFLPNKITGKIADPNNLSFYPFTQSRTFTQLPNWGTEFITASDVRKDYLAASEEDAYSAEFYFDIRSVRPITRRATAGSIIN